MGRPRATDPKRNAAISLEASLIAALQEWAKAQGASYSALCRQYLIRGLVLDGAWPEEATDGHDA